MQSLQSIATALSLIVSTMITPATSAQSKPNVVIMQGDNVAYGDIGAYGAG